MRDAPPGEPLVREDVPDEPPPILGRWSRLYAVVLGELLLMIALCAWLSRTG